MRNSRTLSYLIPLIIIEDTTANQQINGNYGVEQSTSSLKEVQRLINYRTNAIMSVSPTMGAMGGNFGGANNSSNDPMGI